VARNLETLDSVKLAGVTGGGLFKNTDVTRGGLSFPGAGPVPLPKESSFSVRTNYGSCVDNKAQQCGTGANAGQCMIDAANSCWREIKDKE
jgi:hypothetical protein